MLTRSDNRKWQLYTSSKGYVDIPPPLNYDSGGKDKIVRDDDLKSFIVEKPEGIELHGQAYNTLLEIVATKAINEDVYLIEKKKDPKRKDQRWKQFDPVALDLGTLKFDEEKNTVKVDSRKLGLMNTIESKMDDEFDIMNPETLDGDELPELTRGTINLPPRKIFRKSRLELPEEGREISASVSGGDGLNARAVPFQIDYSSDENIASPVGVQLSAAGGNYSATLGADKVSNLSYLTSDRDRQLRINGWVEIEQTGTPHSGTFTLDLVIYENGEDFDRKEVINLDVGTPYVFGSKCGFEFDDYELPVLAGESWVIACLSDTLDGIDYTATGELIIEEDSSFPTTTAPVVTVYDAIDYLLAIITGEQNLFRSEIFDPEGVYKDTVITHGTWLRNMPRIINEGEEDEQEIQAPLSVKMMMEALQALVLPIKYGSIFKGRNEYFFIESEQDAFKNFKAIRLSNQVSNLKRTVLPDNYYSSIILGSDKTGEDYSEVNNLKSIGGKAQWSTINDSHEAKYEYTTDFRTGSVGIELTRQKQYSEYPDEDTERDGDWFIIDAKYTGVITELIDDIIINPINAYTVKHWQDYYTEKPTGIYDVDSEYNFFFTPYEILKRHGWRIAPAVKSSPTGSLKFASSNCNSSIVTDGFKNSDRVPHSIFGGAKFRNMMVEFETPIDDDIKDMLSGDTNGVDNKHGVVEYIATDGYIRLARLIEVDENGKGKWQLIEI